MTRAVETPTVLRLLLQAAGDPAPITPRLHWRPSTAPVIAYKSQGAGDGTESNGAALSLTCPATVDAGDILIAHVFWLDTTSSPDTPADWTLLYGPADMGTGTAVGRAWVFGKIAVGDEDGDAISFGTAGGTSGRAGRIYSFSGALSGFTLAQLVPTASFSDTPSEDDPPAPTVTTTVEGALAVALICQDDNNVQAAFGAVTGGTWAEAVAEFVSTGLGAQGLACGIQTATPTGNPGTITGGSMTTATDESSTIGFEIRPHPVLVELAASANIDAGGEAISSARLTGGTGSFTTGRIWDDENGTDSIDIGEDGHTEVAWCVQGTADADGLTVDFRVTNNGAALNTYTHTPSITFAPALNTVEGTASGAGGGTATATGLRTVLGSVTGSGGGVGHAEGEVITGGVVEGTATGTGGGAGAAVGTRPVLGVGVGAGGGVGAAVGTRVVLGTGSGSGGGVGAATGTVVGLVRSDDFNRANSTNLGPPWVERQGSWEISNNGVIQTDATSLPGFLLYDDPLGADHWVEARLAVSNGDGNIGLMVRFDDVDATCLSVEVADGAYKTIHAIDGEAAGTIATGSSHDHTTGEVYRVEVDGNDISLYLNNSLVFSHTTSTLAGNTRVGLHLHENASGAVRWDDFRAGPMPYVAPFDGELGTGIGVGGGTGASTGTRTVLGTGAGSGGGVGTAAGTRLAVDATATGDGGGVGTAVGLRRVVGTATGSGGGAAAATGLRVVIGTTTGSGGGVGAADGTVTQPGEVVGVGTGLGGGDGTATGLRAVLGAATGLAGGTGTCTGKRVALGVCTGSGGGTGAATGTVTEPPVDTITGTATGVGGGVGACTGVRVRLGTCTGLGGGAGHAQVDEPRPRIGSHLYATGRRILTSAAVRSLTSIAVRTLTSENHP